MKILIVDDSKIIHKIVAKVVEALDFEPAFALNGVEALEQLAKLSDDVALVLMDWNMPEMNGIDCLRAIRADAELANIPVMMLTTESQASQIADAVVAGASNYCTKPFTAEDLSRKIFACLGLGG